MHSSLVVWDLHFAQAIIMFTAGEHVDAISRVDDLIATVRFNAICYVVQARPYALPHNRHPYRHFYQAYMHLLLGNSHMESGDYESAIRSFECARALMRPYSSEVLSVISLVGLLMAIPHCVETGCDL